MTSKALIAASAKPIILSLLLTGESYGYEILQRVRQVSGGRLADGGLGGGLSGRRGDGLGGGR